MTRLTLTQVFALTFGGVAAVVGALFYWQLASARRSVLARSESFRESAAAQIDARITRDLHEASDVVADIERGIRTEAIDARDPDAVEAPLFALLIDHPNVADITITHPERWQVSVYRANADPRSAVVTRVVRPEGDHFAARLRTRAAGEKLRDGVVTTEPAADPTAHPTYEVLVSPENYGKAIWSDLHFSEIDPVVAGVARRVVVTVQKAVDDAAGKPAGVVRVGLLAHTIDEIARMRLEGGTGDDPHRVFLCDAEGRLLTRLAPGDRLASTGRDLRVTSPTLPPELARALASPVLRALSADAPVGSEAFVVGGKRYLLTLRALEDTQGWIAGIVVPEDHYTRDLRALRDRFVEVDLLGAVCALLGGMLVLSSVRSGFRRLLDTTARMRRFDFVADARPAALRDVDEVVQSLERAKTAVRALSKYVPVDLVRQLYSSNQEPSLGGEPARLTIMFTDLRGFTGLSEQLEPNRLAEALGSYLDAMTAAIRSTGGTIDKFIGDSVMALWNAPTPVPDHAKQACRAALLCSESTARLYASDAWRGLPPLVTRFGIHTDDVLVGNFGAPARLAYTALGDGVNLASRLEGLGKQYGVVRVASEAVVKGVQGAFAFRKLDRVAVKGRLGSVLVFELLGYAEVEPGPAIAAYQRALDAYFAREFAEAIATLEPFADVDPPSRVLRERCRMFSVEPPPGDWDGTWVARSK